MSMSDQSRFPDFADQNRPSFLIREGPLESLCHHFNVEKVILSGVTALPETFDMPVGRESHLPTHVLAMYSTAEPEFGPSFKPLMAPIHADLYRQRFRVEVLPPSSIGTIAPTAHLTPQSQTKVVTLPVVPLSVPHIHSIPILFLFGMGLETPKNLMASRLLPAQVIEEFPNAAAMAQIMAQIKSEQLQRYVTFNQGLWKNVLALGPRDTALVELVQTAWNVTAEARRIQQRARQTP